MDDADDVLVRAERNPPIDEVIKQGVIPRFVEFLERNDFPKLQVETSHHREHRMHALEWRRAV